MRLSKLLGLGFCLLMALEAHPVGLCLATADHLSQQEIKLRSTLLSRVDPVYVDLARKPSSLPGRSFLVDENHFALFGRDEQTSYDVLYTTGVITCVAVIIRNQKSGAVLFSHFLTLQDGYQFPQQVSSYVRFLEEQMQSIGGSVKNSDVTLFWGKAQRADYFERIENLVEALSLYAPSSLKLDSTIGKDEEIWDIHIDLTSGQIYKSEQSPVTL